MSIFPWPWQRPLVWSPARRFSGSCSTGVNFISSAQTHPRPRPEPSPANHPDPLHKPTISRILTKSPGLTGITSDALANLYEPPALWGQAAMSCVNRRERPAKTACRRVIAFSVVLGLAVIGRGERVRSSQRDRVELDEATVPNGGRAAAGRSAANSRGGPRRATGAPLGGVAGRTSQGSHFVPLPLLSQFFGLFFPSTCFGSSKRLPGFGDG